MTLSLVLLSFVLLCLQPCSLVSVPSCNVSECDCDILSLPSGRATRRLLVERAAGASKSKEVVVWSVAFLSDHTIICGDSTGKIQIWDGLTGTLVKSHLVSKWDVLALSVSQVSV